MALTFRQWWTNQAVSIKAAEVAATVVALVGVIFGGFQLYEAHVREKFDQRAWLDVENPTYDIDLTKHRIPFETFVRDSGKSPAMQMDGKICLMVRPKILTEAEFITSLAQPGAKCADNPVGAIAPDNKAVLKTVFGNPFFTRDAPMPPHVLYFYGDVTYIDIFHDQHETLYCYRSTEDIEAPLTTCGFRNQMN